MQRFGPDPALRLSVTLAVCVASYAPAAAQNCDSSLVCPMPSAGHACFSGQLFDIETSEPVREASPTGIACTQVTPNGPCSVRVTAYDALGFFQNPTGTPPLLADIMIDDCGRYLISDFPVPGLGFVAFTVDDASPNDNLALSASTSAVGEGNQEHDFPLHALQHATDLAWTTSAGDPFSGQTFSEKGVFAAIFLTGEDPTSGVVLARSGLAHPDDDYYFSDVGVFSRTSINLLQTETGNNGSGLMSNSDLVEHTGIGGELSGCYWPSILGKSLPGAVIVQEFHSLDELTHNPCLDIFTDGFESGNTSAWSSTVQ